MPFDKWTKPKCPGTAPLGVLYCPERCLAVQIKPVVALSHVSEILVIDSLFLGFTDPPFLAESGRLRQPLPGYDSLGTVCSEFSIASSTQCQGDAPYFSAWHVPSSRYDGMNISVRLEAN